MVELSPIVRRIHQAAIRLFAESGVSQVNVRDLAREAGVARGTIYNHLDKVEELFEQVASQLGMEMHLRVAKSFGSISDPAQRLATGIRLFIRRSYEEPQWGAFLVRFAVSNASLSEVLSSQTSVDLATGFTDGRYRFRQEQLPVVLSLIGNSTLGGMYMVLEGVRTWRDVGSDTAELVLRALGVGDDEARRLATADLPTLPALN